ncbi:conserved hypothetical protein [metagenome]|uniref:Uncharacterized protein n=1 Tax=metagenome TaxID=256318 RepID=A0A2P2C384_9ZZZZ
MPRTGRQDYGRSMATISARISTRWQALRHWPTSSQSTSRRNAMVACTALAQHRAEVREVDDYISRAQPRERISAHG